MKSPDVAALKGIIQAMRSMELDKIKGFKKKGKEEQPVLEVEKDDDEDLELLED